jgi:hypothetical protein
MGFENSWIVRHFLPTKNKLKIDSWRRHPDFPYFAKREQKRKWP